MAQTVKNMPAMWETLVWSLRQEDPLEKGMATYSSILAWKIPKTKACGGLQPMGSQKAWKDWVINTFTLHYLKHLHLLMFIVSNVYNSVMHLNVPLFPKHLLILVQAHTRVPGMWVSWGTNLITVMQRPNHRPSATSLPSGGTGFEHQYREGNGNPL